MRIHHPPRVLKLGFEVAQSSVDCATVPERVLAPSAARVPRCCARGSTRVSQINGCSYCVDEHARDLRRAGDSNECLDGLAGWRESAYFTEPEKAALERAESLTRVELTHAPDAAYEPLKRHYDDKQVANITYAIALMNA
jgi:AhpD family alkylhydroperoxidase